MDDIGYNIYVLCACSQYMRQKECFTFLCHSFHHFPSSERDKEKQDPVPPKLGIFSGWDWLMLNPGGLHDVWWFRQKKSMKLQLSLAFPSDLPWGVFLKWFFGVNFLSFKTLPITCFSSFPSWRTIGLIETQDSRAPLLTNQFSVKPMTVGRRILCHEICVARWHTKMEVLDAKIVAFQLCVDCWTSLSVYEGI